MNIEGVKNENRRFSNDRDQIGLKKKYNTAFDVLKCPSL